MLGLSISPEHLIETFGMWGTFAIVFAESGLLFGFFLPGDSLLFTAGAVAAGVLAKRVNIQLDLPVLLIGVLVAAIAGDQVGYAFGRRVGPRLRDRPSSKLFKPANVDRASGFIDRHGPRAIVLARFVPVVRTFAPVMAGVMRMRYPTFVRYNIIGAAAWALGLTLLGYEFGQIDAVRNHIELATLAVVALSLIPLIIEALRHRRRVRVESG